MINPPTFLVLHPFSLYFSSSSSLASSSITIHNQATATLTPPPSTDMTYTIQVSYSPPSPQRVGVGVGVFGVPPRDEILSFHASSILCKIHLQVTTIWALSQSEHSIWAVAMEIMTSQAKHVHFPAKITFCGCPLLEIKFTAPKSVHPQKVILAGKCTCFACDVIISMATAQMEHSDWLRAQIVVTCRCILHNEM